MNFDIGVVGVGFAGKQGLDLLAVGLGLDAFELVDSLLLGGRVALGLAKLDQGDGVFEIMLEFGQRAEPFLKLGALAYEFLREFGIVPKGWIFGFGVQFRQSASRGVDVKDASSAARPTA
jgi:hypothetical protein